MLMGPKSHRRQVIRHMPTDEELTSIEVADAQFYRCKDEKQLMRLRSRCYSLNKDNDFYRFITRRDLLLLMIIRMEKF